MNALSKESLVLIFVLGIACIAGCGPAVKEGDFKVTPLTGKVTLNGSALADADVMFLLQGTAPADYFGSAGKTDAQGNFEAMTGTRKGVPAGKYKVVVSKLVGQDGKAVVNDPSSGMDLEQMKAGGLVKQAVAPEFSDIALTTTEVTVEDGKAPPPLLIDAK
ncbi:MAG: carboxypeptidase regulatory-like domain-containing protein [Pirellulaceae bacterium]|nr:carboxypeptidase regulatory-like domain-containing protein [Pirellulaceae bacterium]